MRFSDNIIRTGLETVFVRRTEENLELSEEYNSLLWDVEKFNICYKRHARVNLYSIPVRDVKIGESIYDNTGKNEIAYRVE